MSDKRRKAYSTPSLSMLGEMMAMTATASMVTGDENGMGSDDAQKNRPM